MHNQPVYPLDFEAQYQQIQEKIIHLVKTNEEKIKEAEDVNPEDLMHSLEFLNNQIQDHELLFRKENIYSQFATPQQLNQSKKNPPEMCSNCGDEIKKPVQCQFCAEIYCKKCCERKRVIPFSKSKDFRLCCETCHKKFVKLFHNKDFYQEKQILLSVINHLKVRNEKLAEKKSVKEKILDQYKKKKLSEKINQKALEKRIKEEEKRIKSLHEEFHKVVTEKAEKIKQEERKKIEKEQLEKKKEEERFQQEKQEEERSKQKIQIHPMKKQQLSSIQGNQEDEIERPMVFINHVPQPEFFNRENQIMSPKKLLVENLAQGKINDTSETKISEKSISKEEKENKKSFKTQFQEQSNVSTNTEENLNIIQKEQKQKQKEPLQIQVKHQEGSLEKAMQNIFCVKKQSFEDDGSRSRKSLKSSISKTSKNVCEMSVNELLALKIPCTPARIPSQKEQDNKRQQYVESLKQEEHNNDLEISEKTLFNLNSNLKENKTSPEHRRTIERTSIIAEEIEDNRMSKEQILRNSSLMTSSNQRQEEIDAATAPQKCSCQIM